MAKNGNLHQAKKAKNDEFWTQMEDIKKEMTYYKDFFKGKVVYCNCDDPHQSNFFKFFVDFFEILGLKKLIATGYNPNGKGWVCEYEGDPDLKLPEPVGKKPLILSKRYDPEKYPKYDNYDAIDVSRVEDIPIDYDGVMGVPVTFLSKINDCYICEDPQMAEELKKKG